jgi:hypothetical protein
MEQVLTPQCVHDQPTLFEIGTPAIVAATDKRNLTACARGVQAVLFEQMLDIPFKLFLTDRRQMVCSYWVKQVKHLITLSQRYLARRGDSYEFMRSLYQNSSVETRTAPPKSQPPQGLDRHPLAGVSLP